MSNGFTNQFYASLEKGKTILWARVSFGAAGAPTLDAANSKGVKSIVRNSTGDYTFTLKDSYIKLLSIRHGYDESGNSGTAPLAPSMFVKAKNITVNTGATIEFVFNSAGTATDPASGEIALFEIALCSSTAI